MKKLIFLMLLLCSSMAGKAQATFSVRAGYGLMRGYDEVTPSSLLNFNSNIPLSRNSQWIFSAGASFEIDSEFECFDIYAPLQFGYKSRLDGNAFFIPKFGLALGYSQYDDAGSILGPHAELSFEFGHFTIGIDGFYSLIENKFYEDEYYTPWGAHLNIGIKF